MKVQLFATVLVLMYVVIHCKPANVKYNGKLRSNRSPVDEYGQPLENNNGFLQEPQFNAQPGAGDEYGFIPNPEAPIYNDGNFQQGPLDQNTPIETQQTVQDSVAELPNTPAKNQPESDEDDDESDPWNISKIGKDGRSSVNFFPVSFGSGRGRSGGFPAGTVAVANSYSTGRKGVASSNANAHA